MKILMINDYELSMLWWWEIHIQELIKLLNKKWIETELLSGNSDEKKLNWIYNIKFKEKVEEYLRNHVIDIVHIHSLSRNISTSFLSIIKSSNIPIVMTVHSFAYNCPKTFWIKKWQICLNKNIVNCLTSKCTSYSLKSGLLKNLEDVYKVIKINFHKYHLIKYVNTFICPSKSLRFSLLKLLKLEEQNIVYIPNFIDISNTHCLDYSDLKSNQLLFVWRLSPEKWIDIAIQAVWYLVKKWINSIELIIIGDWPEKYKLKKLVSNLWLKNHIKFLWRIDNNNLGKYYKESWIILMPSVWLENNPLVALEAMKYWRPIIASNVGWFPDLIEDGKNGYLFKMWNHIDLAEKICKLYEDPNRIQEFGEYGYAKVQKEFGKERFYENLLKIYTWN